MGDTTRAGRSPARACGGDTGVTRTGDRLLGSRIVAAARVAAAMHLAGVSAAESGGDPRGSAERERGVRP